MTGMDSRAELTARVFRSAEAAQQAEDEYWAAFTPAQRVAMMWQLALDAWAFRGERSAESRLPRSVVRIHRRQASLIMPRA